MSFGIHPAKAAPASLDDLLPNPKARLKDQFHEVARFQHLAERTEGSYWDWVVRYLKFHKERSGDWKHPRDLGSRSVTPFLTYLAKERSVSASTQEFWIDIRTVQIPLHQSNVSTIQIYTHLMQHLVAGYGVRSTLS